MQLKTMNKQIKFLNLFCIMVYNQLSMPSNPKAKLKIILFLLQNRNNNKMRKFTLLFFTALLVLNVFAQSNLTLCVDMSQETVNPLGVTVAGSFQGWAPGVDFLVDDGTNGDGIAGDDIYCGTFSVPDSTYEYKFINGIAWGDDETQIPGTCSTNTNRVITVSGTTVAPTVCFNGCGSCGYTPPSIDIKLQLNLANELINPLGVTVAGSFQGWSPGSDFLVDDGTNGDAVAGDGIYTITLNVPIGSYEYKFINGIAWGADESQIPSSCTLGGYGNRFFTASADTCLPVVCFNECNDCITQISGSCTNDVFQWSDVEPIITSSCGGTGTNCHSVGTSGFSISYLGILSNGSVCSPQTGNPIVTPGDTSQSLLIEKTRWVVGGGLPSCGNPMPPPASPFPPLSTPEFNAIADWILQGANEYCPNIIDRNITFCVDMSCSGLTYTDVYVAGTFNGWSADANPLTDDGMNGDLTAGDEIFCSTIVIPEGNYEYKFQIDQWVDSENFIGTENCPTLDNGNRELIINADATISYAWNSCFADCSVPINNYDITFQVNMCEAIDSSLFDPTSQAVFIAGGTANQTGYGNDCGSALSDADGDGVYTLTNSYPDGYPIVFKYYIGVPADAGTGNCNNGNAYEADDIITSNGQVNASSGGTVSYHAGDDYIELTSDFEADGAVDFNALIIDCDQNN